MVSYDYFLDKAGDPYMGKQMEKNRVKHSFFQRLLRTQRLSLLPSRSEFLFCFKVPAVVSYTFQYSNKRNCYLIIFYD